MWPEDYNLENSTCLIFEESIATVSKVRLGMAMLGLFLCIVTALVIVRCKLYVKFTHRLYLYLTIANAAYSATFILQYLAVNYEEKIVYHTPCTAAGFLVQYTGWVVLLFTSIITFHLSCLIIWKKNFKNWKVEVTYVLFGFGFPLMFCWIPFINHTYGLTGDWCWIRWANYIDVDSTSSCPLHLEGVVEKILLWGTPTMILVIVSFMANIFMIILLIKRSRKKVKSEKDKALLIEVLPILIYPIVFYLICTLEIIEHIYFAVHFHDPNFGLWVINALATPMRALAIILSVLCSRILVNTKIRKRFLKNLNVVSMSNSLSTTQNSISITQAHNTSFDQRAGSSV